MNTDEHRLSQFLLICVHLRSSVADHAFGVFQQAIRLANARLRARFSGCFRRYTHMFFKLLSAGILAASLASAQWGGGGLGHGGADEMSPRKDQRTQTRMDRITTMLALDSEQRKQVKSILDDGQKDAAPVRDQLVTAQSGIAEAVQAGKSQDEVGKTIDAYAALDAQMTTIELRSLAKISQALRQEQQAKLGGLFWMMRGIFKNKNWNDAGGW
ncbi:MAG: hypothetical protein ABSH42_20300 [Bryobacteraceae bacterium]|jgi:hypothetical protein